MKAMKIISGLLTVFITVPIWYYILYSILTALHVDRLIWFLFWIYIPVGVFTSTLSVIANSIAEKKEK